MALLFYDGFGHYNTALISTMWTSTQASPTISPTVGRNGGPGLHLPASSLIAPVSVKKTLAPGDAHCIQGALVTPGASLGDLQSIFWVGNASGNQVMLILQADYKLALYPSLTGSQIGSSSTVALSAGVAAYLELDVVIGTSAAYDVRVNGVSVISGTGNTKTQTAATWTVAGPYSQFHLNTAGSVTLDYSDYYCCDGTGAAPYNAPLGDVIVTTVLPTGDGGNTDFTPSTGTSHFALVDENPATGDTDYNSSSTASQRDTYTYPAISLAGGNILAVAPTLYARKDDGGVRTIADVVRRSSTNYDGGSAQTVSSSYAYYQFIRTQDPVTAAAWSRANVNASEFGIELVS